MPAIDQCEPQIVEALKKAGWQVTHQPFAIKVQRNRSGYIFADLRLENVQSSDPIIVVEIKCFSSTRTILEEFYQAIGQYLVYRNALESRQSSIPVYLAVPSDAYDNFFRQPLIQSVATDISLRLIVVDLEKEVIIRWIT